MIFQKSLLSFKVDIYFNEKGTVVMDVVMSDDITFSRQSFNTRVVITLFYMTLSMIDIDMTLSTE